MPRLPTKWITADRRVLRIAEMSDEHLRNAMRFIERNLPAVKLRAYGLCPVPRGEAARDAAESAWLALMEQPVDEFPLYAAMARELRRRAEAGAEIAAEGSSAAQLPVRIVNARPRGVRQRGDGRPRKGP